MMRGVNQLRRTITRGWGRLFPGAIILLYHRIAELPSDPFGLAVTPRAFAEHLEVLRAHGRPISLQHLIRALRGGKVPRKAVVVTFDDGYADNLHAAKPLLEQFDVPATVFISSGYIGQEREFWWDELECLLLRPGTLPQHLEVSIGGEVYRDDLGEDASYSLHDFNHHRRWSWSSAGGLPSARHRLYRSLYPRLQRLPREGQLQGLQALWDCADTRRLTRPECRPLSGEELIRLSESRLIEIGAHTHNHVSLGDLPCSVQKREIVIGKAWLEEQLSRSIASFSYPYGLYTSETVGIVRDAGFSDACSTRCLPLRGNEDPYELPRVWPGNWDGEQLSMALRGWFYA